MLHIKSVSKGYPGQIMALKDVNLAIPSGMFGLLGPNGAGKSTLMRTLATLQQPDKGSITFNGLDIFHNTLEFRAQLGYLPQYFGAYPRMSARAMLKHFAVLKGIEKKAIDDTIDQLLVLTNLWDAKDRAVEHFSGGMKQRYGIAQALIGNPRLIITDEPTAGLDPVERRRFQNLLAQLSADVTVLLSTHIVDDVEELCPNIAIMAGGQVLQAGSSEALSAQLLGRMWTVRIKPSQLDDMRSRYLLISDRIKSGHLEARLVCDNPPDDAQATQPTLEDVYFYTLQTHGRLADFQ